MTDEKRKTSQSRYGITIPFEGIPLSDQPNLYRELEELGYTDLWSAEADSTDAFVPLALAATSTKHIRLGTAVVPAYTRGPGLLACQVDAISELAIDRFVFGIGTSSNVIVSKWNNIEFKEPYRKVRDTVNFLRKALSGEKVRETYDTFEVDGFKLGRNRGFGAPPRVIPPIYIAALRPQMLRLAGRLGDGAILNWFGAADVEQVKKEVLAGSKGQDRDLVARIFVIPNAEDSQARAIGRMAIAAYLNVEVYKQFHIWLGRDEILKDMWELWQSGDRKKALEAIPDEVVDDLIIHGSYDECRNHVMRYVRAGITTPVLAIIPVGVDHVEAIKNMAPNS